MNNYSKKRVGVLMFSTLTVITIHGCANPFAGETNSIDWAAKSRLGTITVSDPKLHRRESLIEERRKEVEWIDSLIEGSKKIEFKSEVLREVETISAFSAALGLKFDPAAAVSFENNKDKAELSQQIDTLKLQLQLDQLKRDAELIRKQFESQAQPVNSELGVVSTETATLENSSSLSAVDQLKSAIERLSAATYDFNRESKGAAITAADIHPIDDFRNRQAYRDTLKAARNAASLDELHDWGSAALLRLNFQATLVPDVKKSGAPGVIQMKVKGPKIDSPLSNQFYLNWLKYINKRTNVNVNGVLKPDFKYLQGELTTTFQIVKYLYGSTAVTPSDINCTGIISDNDSEKYKTCKSLTLLAPRYLNTKLGGNAYLEFTTDINQMLSSCEQHELRRDMVIRTLISSHGRNLLKDCQYVHAPITDTDNDGRALRNDEYILSNALETAKARMTSGNFYLTLEVVAHEILKENEIEPPLNPDLEKVIKRTSRASLLHATYLNTVMTGCTVDERKTFDKDAPVVYLSPVAKQILWDNEPRVAIYETGPREQVQQVSTVARAAKSLELAVSAAVAKPGSGKAVEAAAGYAKSAMGRAEAIERVPTVVGYSVGSAQTFGWVFGPKATVNPNGKINLEQTLRTHDLTVDLSVPGWWPYFTLETVTAWAPNREQLVNGTIAFSREMTGTEEHAPKIINVSMSPNASDYASLTKLIAAHGFEVRNRDIELGKEQVTGELKVSACHPSTIALRGEFLWRATTVIIGGLKIGTSAISIMPDMSGIFVDVPALDGKVQVSGNKTRVTVFTPYGPSRLYVDYDKPEAGCKKAEAKPEPNAPSILDHQPKSIQLPGLVTISVKGNKLEQIKGVSLSGITGEIVSQSDKALTVQFSEAATKTLIPSDNHTVSFSFDKGGSESSISVNIAIVANVRSN